MKINYSRNGVVPTESINRSAYIRKVDKVMIPTCNILGVNIAAIDMNWVVKYFRNYIKKLSGDYVCLTNVHTTVTSYEDPEYLAIQNGGIMALPDGGPLSTVGRKRGYNNMARVTGPSLMDEIFKISVENGYRHYFYGSTKKTLEKLYDKLQENYPGIQIAGLYSPLFSQIISEEDEVVINKINDTNSDFVWIGLGAPKQEKWMAIHQGKIKGLMLGVGAAFDYFAENIKRAPNWMQQNNMEWFYRLLQEPRRLFGRYLKSNTKFLWLVVSGK
jgi:N-acetylglucosaminyldiphosphoundecaprenol N-acetyl-beta-D-mannosaminyltransferase